MGQRKRKQLQAHDAEKPMGAHDGAADGSALSEINGATRSDTTTITSNTAQIFICFMLPHLVAASITPIQDCDEVFNYWEPSHYLNHGYGFQTWEYSPVYAIRSWTYAGLHSAIIAPAIYLMSSLGGKDYQFFFLRSALGIICALCETRLFQVMSKTTSPRMALLFMLIMITSSGMFHASIAYLPSSFSMYTAMLGIADFMEWRSGKYRSRAFLWFAVGAILGWPFAAALVFPFVVMELSDTFQNGRINQFARDIVATANRSIGLAVAQALVDRSFYGKLVCVPLNIILYNVFAGASKGPEIYGTEAWHFYLRNLILNFNIWLPVALSAHPLLFLRRWSTSRPVSKQPFNRSVAFTSTLYVWLLIYTVQPHKEERFMYPAYPLIAINAAYSVQVIFESLAHDSPAASPIKISPVLQLLFIIVLIISSAVLSALRTAGLVTGYSAPLRVYKPLQIAASPGDIVCLGKEWYRFPSSYFLPHGVEARFIKSAFNGLLPGQFASDRKGGTKAIPSGMNDENREDPGKYVDISKCIFLVDSHMLNTQASDVEPDYIHDVDTWQALTCERFLDAGATPALGRILWLPEFAFLPPILQRHWGTYCLLARKSRK